MWKTAFVGGLLPMCHYDYNMISPPVTGMMAPVM
ncbi:hypothetical protein Rleg5DRAFT_7079 [Rhizobium leguminosarum bv. viciae WSM1455]|nr:hypothetical protein Rleg5DRAFT_7079 [Rhizobium leguminosarum bv. viciae WSM1455]